MVTITVFNHLGQVVARCGPRCHNNQSRVPFCPCTGILNGVGAPKAKRLFAQYHQVIIPKAQAWQKVKYPGGKVRFAPVQLPLF